MKITVHYFDSNIVDINDILSNTFLSEKDLKDLGKYHVLEVKKEKAISTYFKNRYIGKYYINEYGKPLSDKCFFNISHSKGVIAFASTSYPIGIDLEVIREVNEDLVQYISSKEEYQFIQTDTDFYKLWTSKEALVKLIGTGIKSKVNEIPGLPLNDIRKYENHIIQSKTMEYENIVLTVAIETKEEIEIEIVKEKII